MAGYISRSVSLSPIEPNLPSLPNGSNSKAVNGSSSPRINEVTTSPLKIFVLAKKKINDIFCDIDLYVGETHAFLNSISTDIDIVSEKQINEVFQLQDKLKGIREVLSRDRMKVVFFGRTSNGKSAVINAMLQDNILPSGIGHTTNCFLQVEASESSEAYLRTEDSDESLNVQSISQLAHALNSEKFGDSSLVQIYWPKDKCPLLRDDVVLVDSPGIDISPNLDEWIDKFCMDADVFVLVCNAESTLMLTEKNFFHKVSERLSKPNMFILNNRWDASADDMFLDKVRKQHMDRSVNFLVDELKVVNRAQAENRVFFVSAKEMLQARLQQQKGLLPHTGALATGFQDRYFEFQDFEKKFEECLSKTAVKTKFEQHTQRGKTITSDLRKLLDEVHEKSSLFRSQKLSLRKEQHDRLDFTQQQLSILTQEVKHDICHIVESIEQKVAAALSEEIRRLSIHVDEFERPFHSDSLVLSVYKKELNSHVEQGLGSNLRGRLSSQVQMIVESSQKDMTERMSSLIPPEHRPKMVNVMPRHSFEVLYRLNCESLCSDFQEDLEFKFSFGLLNMAKYFFGPSRTKRALGKTESVPWPIPSTPQTPSNEVRVTSPTPEHYYYLLALKKLLLVSPTSQSAVALLAVGGCLVKAVGWQIIFGTVGVYGLLYAYERLTWTNKAKERAFKRQYIGHTTRKLRLIVDLTSANCSHQVQQELSSTFARLCHLVDEVISDMQNEIGLLNQDTQRLDESSTASRTLRNKADYLFSELETFSEQYLQYEQ